MKVKIFLFIAALVLIILPPAADAHLILYPGFESSTSRDSSNIGLLNEHGDILKMTLVSAGNYSSLHLNFDISGNTPSEMGWTADTTALLLFTSQTPPASSPYIDNVQGEKKPDQIPASIILFAPGLAGILVRRNWPQRLSLRTLKRSILELIHHASGFSIHGNLLKRILLTNGFFTYFQFIHFKLRTIQLNQ
jgi:hypothetical protein